MENIIIKGAREHNLKNIDVIIPKNKLVVFTGLSGSGKSSLAFDTIYAEGQRRYVESLSSYARQFLGIMKKPDIDLIEGLSPAISIDQKGASHNPRSTVGTVTEIYDYLRLLYARIGRPHCPTCKKEISHMSKEQIVNAIIYMLKKNNEQRIKILLLAPLVKDRKGEYSELFIDLKKRGYKKIRIDKRIYLLDEDVVLIKTNKHTIELVLDQIVLTKKTDTLRIATNVEQSLRFGNGEIIVSTILDKGFVMPEKPIEMKDELFSEKFACPDCGISISEIEPRIFSFNTPHGACADCNGIGNNLTVDQELVLNKNLSINEGAILPFSNLLHQDTWFARTFRIFCDENNISTIIRIVDMRSDKVDLLLHGTGSKEYMVEGKNRWGRKTIIEESFYGIIKELRDRYMESESILAKTQIEKYMRYEKCITCNGSRLKVEALSITIHNKSIIEISNLSITECFIFINNLSNLLLEREKEIGKIILKEITTRLQFLIDVGLEYLNLSRGAHTLSGGEAQRIRLASQIGSGLTGVLYVLDEPSIGLHQRDNARLIKTLIKLKDLGNSVIVVEHDEETMLASDYLLDFGPGAGQAGGSITSMGTVDEIKKDPNSLTGQFLSGNRKIMSIRKPKKEFDKQITIINASENNLKNINISFPLNALVVVTGVSGSGKSTLVNNILYHALMREQNPFHREKPGEFKSISGSENIKSVFLIDQSPIGRTPRSNPATYTGCFSYIRELFSKTKEAKLRGYGPGRFSFNVKGGRCETCEGGGQIKIEMQFLADVYIVCETCAGKQYNNEALEIFFNGKNIAEILNMTVLEALDFFSFIPNLAHKIKMLNDVGLSYIKLGQPAPTLSGGEAQRIKLSAELSKKGRDAIYLLDEPTTGLHFADLEKLLFVLRRLVDQGNTIIVIEHNIDVIKNADYIIDLGPEGGEKGGEIIAQGTPEQIANTSNSYTGQFLKKIL